MQKHTVIVTIIASLILAASCNNQESVTGLFSGTMSTMEIEKDGERIVTDPSSLFLTLMENTVQYEGELYPLEILSDEGDLLRYQTSLQLEIGLTVSTMSLDRNTGRLTLEIADPGRVV